MGRACGSCLLVNPKRITLNFRNSFLLNSSDKLQLQCLMHRDNPTRGEALSRLNSQVPTEKVNYADIVIDNSGSRNELEAHVQNLVCQLDRMAG